MHSRCMRSRGPPPRPPLHPHLVCILHRGQAVRNDHYGAPLHQLVNGSLRPEHMERVVMWTGGSLRRQSIQRRTLGQQSIGSAG